MNKYKIAVIEGDGIGPEIITEGIKVIDKISKLNDFEIEWVKYPHGSDRYLATGELITDETLHEMKTNFNAIYLGALGDPRVKPGIIENGILLKARFYFDQFVNLRPIKLLEGVDCPLKDKKPEDIDFTVIRENTEDFYVGIGNRTNIGKTKQELEVVRSLYSVKFGLDIETQGSEIAYQIGVLSQKGSERVIRYAFENAKKKGHTLVTAVDKANVLSDVYGLWREVVEKVSVEYPSIDHEFNYVDAITMWFVKQPEHYQTVVTPNMFGDIITDLGAMIQGGLGLAPGGNINPNGISMFEPIHGSAPKYKGLNVANPLATIWAGALMLDEIGETKSSDAIVKAIEKLIVEKKVLTKDMGGTNTTSQIGDEISRLLEE
ncbi:MAG: isocitrate/isopropylmalate dehydrogenase family protein [Candidatus Aenigmarchaeota archaeon]|nr:isocitrate/isopropylmalate dehydrogenase family protein [Candidatus Aenigmarchaeota archaeon]